LSRTQISRGPAEIGRISRATFPCSACFPFRFPFVGSASDAFVAKPSVFEDARGGEWKGENADSAPEARTSADKNKLATQRTRLLKAIARRDRETAWQGFRRETERADSQESE